jgi:nitrogen fixation-related uncharacterized protein
MHTNILNVFIHAKKPFSVILLLIYLLCYQAFIDSEVDVNKNISYNNNIINHIFLAPSIWMTLSCSPNITCDTLNKPETTSTLSTTQGSSSTTITTSSTTTTTNFTTTRAIHTDTSSTSATTTTTSSLQNITTIIICVAIGIVMIIIIVIAILWSRKCKKGSKSTTENQSGDIVYAQINTNNLVIKPKKEADEHHIVYADLEMHHRNPDTSNVSEGQSGDLYMNTGIPQNAAGNGPINEAVLIEEPVVYSGVVIQQKDKPEENTVDSLYAKPIKKKK